MNGKRGFGFNAEGGPYPERKGSRQKEDKCAQECAGNVYWYRAGRSAGFSSGRIV